MTKSPRNWLGARTVLPGCRRSRAIFSERPAVLPQRQQRASLAGRASRGEAGRMPGGPGSRHRGGAGGRIPADALRGYGVDAAAMSSWLHDRGIHTVWARQGPVLMLPV
jgi:hypothetical protein